MRSEFSIWLLGFGAPRVHCGVWWPPACLLQDIVTVYCLTFWCLASVAGRKGTFAAKPAIYELFLFKLIAAGILGCDRPRSLFQGEASNAIAEGRL